MLVVLVFVYWAVLAAVTWFAWRFGGRDEKVAAALIATSSILTPLVRAIGNKDWHAPQLSLFILESLLLAALLALALTSRRYWPMTTASFQLLCVLTHPAVAIEPETLPISYALLQGFWAYPMLATIVIGTRRYQQRLRTRERISVASLQPVVSKTLH